MVASIIWIHSSLNPSAWNAERGSPWRNHLLAWSAERDSPNCAVWLFLPSIEYIWNYYILPSTAS
jgi:hypothetical protein